MRRKWQGYDWIGVGVILWVLESVIPNQYFHPWRAPNLVICVVSAGIAGSITWLVKTRGKRRERRERKELWTEMMNFFNIQSVSWENISQATIYRLASGSKELESSPFGHHHIWWTYQCLVAKVIFKEGVAGFFLRNEPFKNWYLRVGNNQIVEISNEPGGYIPLDSEDEQLAIKTALEIATDYANAGEYKLERVAKSVKAAVGISLSGRKSDILEAVGILLDNLDDPRILKISGSRDSLLAYAALRKEELAKRQ